jgi:hypothetical protein
VPGAKGIGSTRQKLRERTTLTVAAIAMCLVPSFKKARKTARGALVCRLQDPGMAGFKDFREIVAWQLVNELKLMADAFVAKPEVARRFKFCDQAPTYGALGRERARTAAALLRLGHWAENT